jgi:hypothetical protein
MQTGRRKSGKKLFLERMKRAKNVKHLSSIYTMCVDRVATWSVSMSDDFDNADNRLKDVKGEPMLLKLMVQIGIKV